MTWNARVGITRSKVLFCDERTELEGNDQNGNPTSHAESRHHTNQRIWHMHSYTCTHTHTWIHWYCCTSHIHTCRHTHPYAYSQAAFAHVRQTNMDSHEHIHTHPQINTNTCAWRHTNTTQPLPRDSETENKSFSSAVFEKSSLCFSKLTINWFSCFAQALSG